MNNLETTINGHLFKIIQFNPTAFNKAQNVTLVIKHLDSMSTTEIVFKHCDFASFSLFINAFVKNHLMDSDGNKYDPRN